MKNLINHKQTTFNSNYVCLIFKNKHSSLYAPNAPIESPFSRPLLVHPFTNENVFF